MIFYQNILNFSRIVSGKGIDISKMLTSQTSLDVSIKLQIPETISLSYAGFPTKSIYLYQEPGRLGELEAPTSRTTFLRKIIISYVIVFALVLTNRSKSKFKKKD